MAKAAPDVRRDALLRVARRAWVVPGVLESVALDVPVRRAVREILMVDRRGVEQPGDAAAQAGSHARLAEADSNSVSEEPWERQAVEP